MAGRMSRIATVGGLVLGDFFPQSSPEGRGGLRGRGGRIGGDALVYDYDDYDDGAHYGGLRELMRTLFR
jgi:hypothetical protein